MDTPKPAAQLSEHELSLLQKAIVLTEKLHSDTQTPSTSATHEPNQLVSTPPEDINDTASNFSGYSMLTPSAATKSDRDEVKPPLEQQVTSEEPPEDDVVSDGEELESNADDFDIDANGNQQQGTGSATVKHPPMIETTVLKQQSKTAKQKSKLVGVVVTLGQGIDSDEGEKAIQSIGELLTGIPGVQAGQISVVSFGGDEPLEVDLEPSNDSPWGLGKSDGLVATINRATGSLKRLNSPPEPVPVLPTNDFPFLPFPSPDIVDLPPMPDKTATLLAQRMELAEARTLRSLIGSRNNICPCNGFAGYTTEPFEAPKIAESDGSPKLSDLIEIAKAKVHHELTARVLPAGLVDAKVTATGAGSETFHSVGTQVFGSKSMMFVRGERVMTVGLSMLSLMIVSIVLGIVYMNTQTRGRCMGIWLPS